MNLTKSKLNKYFEIIKSHDSNIDIEKVKVFESGWDHVVLLVEDKKAFKIPRVKKYYQSLNIEINFLKSFASISPAKVPQMEQFTFEGIPYAIYKFIPGKSLTTNIFKSLSDQQKLDIAQKLGEFLTTLHNFSTSQAIEFGARNDELISYWKKSLSNTKEKVAPYLNDQAKEWVSQIFKSFIKLIEENKFQKTVTHFDLYDEHILVDPEHKLAGIIDFADLRINDPAFDFSALLTTYGESFTNEVLRNYQRKLDKTFMKRLEFYKERWRVADLGYALISKNTKEIDRAKKALLDFVAAKK